MRFRQVRNHGNLSAERQTGDIAMATELHHWTRSGQSTHMSCQPQTIESTVLRGNITCHLLWCEGPQGNGICGALTEEQSWWFELPWYFFILPILAVGRRRSMVRFMPHKHLQLLYDVIYPKLGLHCVRLNGNNDLPFNLSVCSKKSSEASLVTTVFFFFWKPIICTRPREALMLSTD